MDDQESERKYYERHLTERHLERFERAFESIKKDIADLQKQDSRQHLILFVLLSGYLGFDISRLALFKSALNTNAPVPVQDVPNQN